MALDFLNPFSGNGIFSGSSKSIPGKLFDPGAADRERAKKAQQQGVQDWSTLATGSGAYGPGYDDNGKPLPAGAVNPMTFKGLPGTANIDPNQMSTYMQGPTEKSGVTQEGLLSPAEAAFGLGVSPVSNWTNQSSAYDSLGPSAYGGLNSAFSGLGDSAGANLAFDKGALGQEQQGADYFGNLSKTGSDPIAEADFQKHAAQAEQARGAQSAADLASLEQKGQGNAGGSLLATLSNNQHMASDMYGAGLDANAMAAQRRDTAASQGANIGHTMGQDVLSGDVARSTATDAYNRAKAQGMDEQSARKAAGLDTYSTNVAQGKDTFANDKNTGLDAWANNRYNDFYGLQHNNALALNGANQRDTVRGQTVSDAGADMRNNAYYFNNVTAPQTRFQNETTAVAGKTGQLGSLAGTEQDNAKNKFAFGPFAANTVGNVAKAVA